MGFSTPAAVAANATMPPLPLPLGYSGCPQYRHPRPRRHHYHYGACNRYSKSWPRGGRTASNDDRQPFNLRCCGHCSLRRSGPRRSVLVALVPVPPPCCPIHGGLSPPTDDCSILVLVREHEDNVVALFFADILFQSFYAPAGFFPGRGCSGKLL